MAKGTLLDGLKSTKRSTSSPSGSTKAKTRSSISSTTSTSTKTKASGKSSGGANPASSKKLANSSSSATTAKKAKKERGVVENDDHDDDDDAVIHIDSSGKERRPLRINDPKYAAWHRKVLAESLEGMELLHCEKQSKIETILKLFDLDPDYGPAAGMTRLERWERASKWGLNPPAEVHEILMSIEGERDATYRESLYHGMV